LPLRIDLRTHRSAGRKTLQVIEDDPVACFESGEDDTLAVKLRT
jgi:hypothetical protein